MKAASHLTPTYNAAFFAGVHQKWALVKSWVTIVVFRPVMSIKQFQSSLWCQKTSCRSIQSRDRRRPWYSNQKSFQCTRFQLAMLVYKASHTRCIQNQGRQSSNQNTARGDPHTEMTGTNNSSFWRNCTSGRRIHINSDGNGGRRVRRLRQWIPPVSKIYGQLELLWSDVLLISKMYN